MRRRQRFGWIFVSLIAFSACWGAQEARSGAPGTWHSAFYRGGGGWWASRIPVEIFNDTESPLEGHPVVIQVGTEPGQAHLVGCDARTVRVCDATGTELLYAVYHSNGGLITEGPILEKSMLLVPVACAAHARANLYLYFDNPEAGKVADFLPTRPGLVNGNVEIGEGEVPSGWVHDVEDAQHLASWSDENPQSGRHCLKTVVAEGAEPSWIATRQYGIPVTAGARYTVRAWVKGVDVTGFAGWYLHLGNRTDSMLTAPTLHAGDGTFDWREVSLDFTAPTDADRLSLGTVLRGTGTAWFDNITIECHTPGKIQATAKAVETYRLREIGAKAAWRPFQQGGALDWEYRAAVTVTNPRSEDSEQVLVAIDTSRLEARLRGKWSKKSLCVTQGDQVVPHTFLGDQLLVQATLPGQSRSWFYLYVTSDPNLADTASFVEDLAVQGKANLVANAGFEEGGDLPSDWTNTATDADSRVEFRRDHPGRPALGQWCVKMHVPEGESTTWRGWHQAVPVQPGRSYLLAAWLKCQDIGRGEARVHAHRLTATGAHSQHQPFASIGPGIQGSTDWTLLTGILDMPSDTAKLQLHLTMDAAGTLWHDSVSVTEVVSGKMMRWESQPERNVPPLALWQVPSVVKVFPDDPPPIKAKPLRISAARNEREPLQLAIRSRVPVAGARLTVEPAIGPRDVRLDDLSVHVVGYVPVDAPTNYYTSETSAWERKLPKGGIRSDGWPGLWPDPLLPRSTVILDAQSTQPVWITFNIPADAPPGDYSGRLRLCVGDQVLSEQSYQVHVWDFSLPETSHVSAIYDVRLGPGAALWGQSIDDIYPEIIRFMASRRLCPDSIRPAPVFRTANGKIVADFADFDRAAHVYFDELKFPHAYTPWSLYLFGWGHPPKSIFGEQPYEGEPPYEGVDRSQLRPEYKRVYQEMLRLYWTHVQQKGWADKITLYISDEPFDHHPHIQQQMKALCDMIHEVDADIPIYSSTWKHVPEWDGYLDVWGIGHDGRVPADKIMELRKASDRVWFTTDGQMCTDTPYCGVERLLPHYCFKFGAQAYEFWGLGWLTHDPYEFGWHAYIHQSSEPGKSYWIRYPNGDGFLLYPPQEPGGPLVSSIRLEQACEGVEDYEYLRLLRHRIEEVQASGGDVQPGRAAMEKASALVDMPNEGGCKSTKILPHPEQLYQVRLEVAAAIERLSRQIHTRANTTTKHTQ